MIALHEEIKSRREGLETQLQQVKGEIDECAALEDRDSMATEDSISMTGETSTRSKFYDVNSIISSLSGVQIGEIGENRIEFHLTVPSTRSKDIRQFALIIEFEPFNNCAIRSVNISPPFPVLADIFEHATKEDTQFVILETMNRIRAQIAVNEEMDNLTQQGYRVNWQPESYRDVRVSREGISCLIKLPFDYPYENGVKVEELLAGKSVLDEQLVPLISSHSLSFSLYCRMSSTRKFCRSPRPSRLRFHRASRPLFAITPVQHSPLQNQYRLQIM